MFVDKNPKALNHRERILARPRARQGQKVRIWCCRPVALRKVIV